MLADCDEIAKALPRLRPAPFLRKNAVDESIKAIN